MFAMRVTHSKLFAVSKPGFTVRNQLTAKPTSPIVMAPVNGVVGQRRIQAGMGRLASHVGWGRWGYKWWGLWWWCSG
jgi:hypothetical protein